MKKLVFILIFLHIGNAIASGDLAYILGMRNNRNAFVGFEYNSKFGLGLENSILAQRGEKQYVRVALFYRWNLGYDISGSYLLYAGMRYDQDYYDIGSRLDLAWRKFRYFQIIATFSPFYDSFLKKRVGYLAYLQSFPLEEVGVFAGIKNLPDFREVERRYIGGLVIKTGNICVKPELSIPANGEIQLMRASVFFVYRNLFY